MPSSYLAWVVFFVSAGLLGFELSLMRVLLVASWHHFAFVVVSLALVGFGASGVPGWTSRIVDRESNRVERWVSIHRPWWPRVERER